jgi:hypothetical protein
MIKQIKTEKFTGVAVLVPDGTSGYALKGKEIVFDIKHGLNTIWQELPFECSVVVGAWPGLTEGQCSDINDENTFIPQNSNLTERDRFASLMQSIGCEQGKQYVILRRVEG